MHIVLLGHLYYAMKVRRILFKMATAEVKKILFIDTSYDQRWQSQHSLCLIDAFHIILICIRNLPGSSLNLSPLVSTQCIYHFHFTFHNLLGPLPKLLAAQTDKQIYIKLSLSINVSSM